MSKKEIITLQPHQQQQQEAMMQQAIDYMRDFNKHAKSYKLHKTDDTLVYIERIIVVLTKKIQPQCLVLNQLDVTKFFVDLHVLMSSLDHDSEMLWSCVTLIQHCSRNLDVRRAIVEQFCYVPLLSYILKRTQRQERVHRLLLLLQELTYGIHIAWEEPYLGVLFTHLVDIIQTSSTDAASNDDDNSVALLALSILINLCYKNFVALQLFLRTVNISSFSKCIQHFGMLANKMLIILSEDVHAFDQRELHTFLRTIFGSIDECIKQWNVPQLRHIVDFLLDAPPCHAGLHRAMLSHTHYCEDIERLLNRVEERCSMDLDSSEETRKHQQLCMQLVFRLISHILELGHSSSSSSSNSDIAKNNNNISLDAIIPRLYELVSHWMESDICGIAAIELLCNLLREGGKGGNSDVTKLITNDSTNIDTLIWSVERVERGVDCKPAAYVAAVLRLLLTLLGEQRTEKMVLGKISESFFDKMLAGPLGLPVERLMQPALEQAVYCMHLLINCAGIAKKAYLDKCCAVLELPTMQYALARAMLYGNESLTAAVFQISQFEHFPNVAVAKHVAVISSGSGSGSCRGNGNNSITQFQSQSTTIDDWRNLSAILKYHRTYSDKEKSQRVNTLIENISGILKRNEQLQDAPVSQIIELYGSRIDSLSSERDNLQQRLEQASNQLYSAIQLNHVQQSQLDRFQGKNFELLISQERLQTQCKDLTRQKDEFKTNMANLLKQFSDNVLQVQTLERRLIVRESEFTTLQAELRNNLDAKSKELAKQEAINKENCSRIEKLKKSMAAFEQDIKEKMRSIDERDKELAKTHKALEEQREGRKKMEDLVSVLEKQLQEKLQQIENLEMEQKETEDMRKTIMSLMESKKPKRNANAQ